MSEIRKVKSIKLKKHKFYSLKLYWELEFTRATPAKVIIAPIGTRKEIFSIFLRKIKEKKTVIKGDV